MKDERLLSIDALRGFDMLFIMGGAALLVALAWRLLSGSLVRLHKHLLSRWITLSGTGCGITTPSSRCSFSSQASPSRSLWQNNVRKDARLGPFTGKLSCVA